MNHLAVSTSFLFETSILQQEDFTEDSMAKYSFQINQNDPLQARYLKLSNLVETLKIRESVGCYNAFALIKKLISADILDFIIERSNEDEILIYRKEGPYLYRNIMIDEDGTYTFKFVASDPRESIFEIQDYENDSLGFISGAISFFNG